VSELVAYAKADPGKLNYGSAGHWQCQHLAASCSSCAPASTSSMSLQGRRRRRNRAAGRASADVLRRHRRRAAFLREGTLRALAVSSEARNPLVPEVPTMRESGVPDYVVSTYVGVVAPAATPGLSSSGSMPRSTKA